MGDPKSLINLGDWSKPANTLIEKISDAIGGLCEPWHIRRVAEAQADAAAIQARGEAEAGMIATTAQIEVTELQRRAVRRFIVEETKKQDNIETIIRKALPQLDPQASPERVENDWIANFFDKCRLISDEEMQTLWAKVLAGEANSPGKFSKRAVNLVAGLDKSDAMLFSKFCGFIFVIAGGGPTPLIYDTVSAVYINNGMNLAAVSLLETIGLIHLNPASGYARTGLGHSGELYYFGRPVWAELPKPENNELQVGIAILSHAGAELAPICGAQPVEGFVEYVTQKWRTLGYKTEPEAQPATVQGMPVA